MPRPKPREQELLQPTPHTHNLIIRGADLIQTIPAQSHSHRSCFNFHPAPPTLSPGADFAKPTTNPPAPHAAVPVLAGRTAVQAYSSLLASFCEHAGPLLGSVVTDLEVGLGPSGELRYPSAPADRRWDFPGIGEFQCYDRFMLASLHACAQQVGRPHWGLGGPHDAGCYCQWPHETGFFNNNCGSWSSAYGSFFLQWYSARLAAHADAVLGAAAAVLDGSGVRMHARLPLVHWWYNQAAHAVRRDGLGRADGVCWVGGVACAEERVLADNHDSQTAASLTSHVLIHC